MSLIFIPLTCIYIIHNPLTYFLNKFHFNNSRTFLKSLRNSFTLKIFTTHHPLYEIHSNSSLNSYLCNFMLCKSLKSFSYALEQCNKNITTLLYSQFYERTTLLTLFIFFHLQSMRKLFTHSSNVINFIIIDMAENLSLFLS